MGRTVPVPEVCYWGCVVLSLAQCMNVALAVISVRDALWILLEQAYGGLNGWSSYLTDATRFFRGLEAVREKLTGRAPAWRREAAQR